MLFIHFFSRAQSHLTNVSLVSFISIFLLNCKLSPLFQENLHFLGGGVEEGGFLFYPHLGKAGGQAEKPPTQLAGGLFCWEQNLPVPQPKTRESKAETIWIQWQRISYLSQQPRLWYLPSCLHLQKTDWGSGKGPSIWWLPCRIWCQILVFQLEIK